MAGNWLVNVAVGNLAGTMQEFGPVVLFIQLVLAIVLFALWYKYEKEKKMPAWAMGVSAVASFLSNPVGAVTVFVVYVALYYHMKSKTIDWTQIFIFLSLIMGMITLVSVLMYTLSFI